MPLAAEENHMGQSLQQLTADEVQSLPIDSLAILVLKHLYDTKEWNSYNFLNSGMNERIPVPTLKCWSEAINWLVSKNLVAHGIQGNSNADSIFITRLGIKVLE